MKNTLLSLALVSILMCLTASCSRVVSEETDRPSPLPAKIKNKVTPNMDYSDVVKILGEPHEEVGCGIIYYFWYFNDETALSLRYRGHYVFRWHKVTNHDLESEPNDRYKQPQ